MSRIYSMFKKDLLLIDLECTGLEVTKHEIIQIAAILLDKKTLREKTRFSSYIKPKNWTGRSRPAMAVNHITWNQVKDAPNLKSVMTQFNKTFSHDVTVTYYGGMLDIPFLNAAYKKLGKNYPFDYHALDLWALFYWYMSRLGKLTNKKRFHGFALEDLAKHFKLAVPPGRHTALTDCLLEAEVLRKVTKAL